jgi:hypothetical protein
MTYEMRCIMKNANRKLWTKVPGRRASILLGALLLLAVLVLPAIAQTGGPYLWYTIAGGGGMSSAGGATLGGSIGQPVAGMSSTGGYTLVSGFWHPDVITITPTPAPPGIINGHLTWQGIAQPNSRNLVPTGTLVLCSGSTSVYSNNTLHTDASGNFTVTTGLADGTYAWKLKGPRHLGNGGSLTISGGSVTFEAGVERTGNANTDNVINSTDFNILKSNFGQPGDRPSDFNFDNVTSSTDFNAQKNNFGQAGVATTCP